MTAASISVGRCVIQCAILGKVSNIHLFKKKDVSTFFLLF